MLTMKLDPRGRVEVIISRSTVLNQIVGGSNSYVGKGTGHHVTYFDIYNVIR